MNDEDRSALEASLEAATARALAPYIEAVAKGFEAMSARFTSIEERLGIVEDRMGAVLQLGGQLGSRLLSIELELAEIKLRIGRLSSDLITGRTQDATRYADIERRLAALESK
jgi:hypothetical protein